MAPALLAALLSLVAPSALSDGIPLATCDTPESFAEVREWIKTVDTQQLKSKLAPPRGNDYQSPLGFVLRSSCFEGRRASGRDEIIRHYNRSAAFLLQQTSRCFKQFSLPSLVDIPALLRVTEFRCEEMKGDMGATTTVGRQEMGGSVHANAVGKHTVKVNIADEKDFSYGTEGFGSLLFHELLHFTANNNRLDHDDQMKKSGFESCNQSQDLDRIYFLQHVCFPSRSKVDPLWGTGVVDDEYRLERCPTVCRRALTERDSVESLIEKYQVGDPDHAKDFYVARPLPSDRVTRICEAITQASRPLHRYWVQLNSLRKDRFDKKIRPLIEFDLEKDFEALLKTLENPTPLQTVRATVALQIAALRPRIQALCKTHPKSCKAHQEPFTSFFNLAEGLLLGIPPNQAALFDFGFRRAPEVP